MYMHVCILHIEVYLHSAVSFHVLGPAETAGDGQVMGGDIKWCLYIYQRL